MADEKKDPGPQPTLDAKAIQDAVAGALAQWTPPQPEVREPQTPAPAPQHRTAEPAERNPLADVVGPLVNPSLERLGVAVGDAKDMASFYMDHPEALKHKKAIEGAFDRLVQQGTAFSRDAVFAWYKGQNMDKFVDEEIATRKAAAEKAEREGATVGAGGAINRLVEGGKDPHTLSTDDLSKSLEGVAF